MPRKSRLVPDAAESAPKKLAPALERIAKAEAEAVDPEIGKAFVRRILEQLTAAKAIP